MVVEGLSIQIKSQRVFEIRVTPVMGNSGHLGRTIENRTSWRLMNGNLKSYFKFRD